MACALASNLSCSQAARVVAAGAVVRVEAVVALVAGFAVREFGCLEVARSGREAAEANSATQVVASFWEELNTYWFDQLKIETNTGELEYAGANEFFTHNITNTHGVNEACWAAAK